MVEVYLKLLEQGYYEVKFAFEGLADENVWKRPAPGLLSVGELAGHIAFWEAVRLGGGGPRPAAGPGAGAPLRGRAGGAHRLLGGGAAGGRRPGPGAVPREQPADRPALPVLSD